MPSILFGKGYVYYCGAPRPRSSVRPYWMPRNTQAEPRCRGFNSSLPSTATVTEARTHASLTFLPTLSIQHYRLVTMSDNGRYQVHIIN